MRRGIRQLPRLVAAIDSLAWRQPGSLLPACAAAAAAAPEASAARGAFAAAAAAAAAAAGHPRPAEAVLAGLGPLHQRSFASSAAVAPQAQELEQEELGSSPLPPRQPTSHPAAAAAPTPARQPKQATFRVEATYVGSKINVYKLMARPEFRGHYHRLHKGAVVLGLTNAPVPDHAEAEGLPLGPYMVAFNYGAVVFFNTADRAQHEAFLAVAREAASEPVSPDRPYNEEYTVTVQPSLRSWSQLDPESIRLQALDLRNLQVISQVLAQSVAMDFYASHVERTLQTFCAMNLTMAQTQNIANINKKVLLQLVAENNIVMTDIINKLGVHERYDIAWKHVQYGRIWEFLRSELEMEPRFKTLDMKLHLIQDNLKYFLEIRQARKSDALEWTIILLIAVEICLSLFELASKSMGGA